MDLNCSHCRAVLDERVVDRERQLATCQACGRLVDVRQQLQGSAQPGAAHRVGQRPRLRPPVQLPAGMMLGTLATGGIEIRRPWLRSKHWAFLVVCVIGSAVVGKLWLDQGPSAGLIVASVFALNWDLMVLTMFLNLTTVRADAAGVQVRHTPLPSLFARNVSISRAQLKQLFTIKYGSGFAVKAELNDGRSVNLVTPLVAADQALFIEQQLERVLGLVDFEVEGELGSQPGELTVQGEPLKGARSGAAVALTVPALVIGVLVLFFVMASTSVEGTLHASGTLGNWELTPDDCVSGQREGFGGVMLTTSGSGRALRVVNDPVKGMLLVLVQPGRDNQVLGKASCSSFDVQTERTNTNINDIWAVDGHANIDCPELRGKVTFEGCH